MTFTINKRDFDFFRLYSLNTREKGGFFRGPKMERKKLIEVKNISGITNGYEMSFIGKMWGLCRLFLLVPEDGPIVYFHTHLTGFGKPSNQDLQTFINLSSIFHAIIYPEGIKIYKYMDGDIKQMQLKILKD